MNSTVKNTETIIKLIPKIIGVIKNLKFKKFSIIIKIQNVIPKMIAINERDFIILNFEFRVDNHDFLKTSSKFNDTKGKIKINLIARYIEIREIIIGRKRIMIFGFSIKSMKSLILLLIAFGKLNTTQII